MCMMNGGHYFNLACVILRLHYDHLSDVFNFLNFCFMKNGNCIDLTSEKCTAVNRKKLHLILLINYKWQNDIQFGFLKHLEPTFFCNINYIVLGVFFGKRIMLCCDISTLSFLKVGLKCYYK